MLKLYFSLNSDQSPNDNNSFLPTENMNYTSRAKIIF